MFPDNSPGGAAYIVTNDKGEKVRCAFCGFARTVVHFFLLSGLYPSSSSRIPRMGQCCRSQFYSVSFSFISRAVTISAANYKAVSAHLDGVPETTEAQQKCASHSIHSNTFHNECSSGIG
jgi:hypothetical protein